MDDTSYKNTLGKRKRGRPRKYSTAEAKAGADVERKRAARRDAPSAQRDSTHTNFYNPVPSLQLANTFGGFLSLANPTDMPQPDQRDVSQFLAKVDPQLEGDTAEQAIFDDGTPADAAESNPVLNYNSPDPKEVVSFDAPPESSPQPGNDESDLVRHLAQKLAEACGPQRSYPP